MTDIKYVMMDDGCRIAFRFDGPTEAPVLLLSNSLGTNLGMWEPQMAAWIQTFRVLRYDQRGHGASDAPMGAYSFDRLGRDVLELLDALDIGQVYFCGLSLGGMVGQWLAVHAPERVDRLIIANTSAYMGPPSNWQSRIEEVLKNGTAALADASIARWFTAAFPTQSPNALTPIRTMLLANDPIGYAGCCAAIRDMDQRRTISLIDIPTLVIGGTLDPATPPLHSHALVQTIAGAELLMLEAAHLSNVEQPAAFARAVLDFLTV